MITIGTNHPIGFVVEHFLHRRVRTDLVPHARLWLQVEADLVRSLKRCFRRTPRMKAHVVEAPLLTERKQGRPRLYVRGRVAGKREVPAAVRAAKNDRTIVEDELIAFSMKIPQADSQIL